MATVQDLCKYSRHVMHVTPVAQEPVQGARGRHALVPGETARGHLMYRKWLENVWNSYASLRRFCKGTAF